MNGAPTEPVAAVTPAATLAESGGSTGSFLTDAQRAALDAALAAKTAGEGGG
jgi:hypothetical protein